MSDALTEVSSIQCLSCNGRMRLIMALFAEGLSAVPNISGPSLECDDCGEYMHVDDAMLSGWATQEEIDSMQKTQ